MTYILTFLLFLTQYIVLPFGVSPFETPKVLIIEVGVILLAIIFFATYPLQTIRKKTYMPFLLLFFLSIMQLITKFPASDRMFFGNMYRMQGIFLFWLLLLFAIIASKVTIIRLPSKIFLAMLSIQLIATVFIQGTVDGRAVGTMGEPNALAAAVLFIWPWTIEGIRDKRKAISKDKGNKGEAIKEKLFQHSRLFFVLAISLFIILFSGSRSGFIAIGIQLLFVSLVSLFNISIKKSVIFCLLLMAFCLLLPFVGRQTVYENRGEIWKTALLAGYEHPITGWGIGNTEVALKSYNKKLFNRLQGYYVDSSHNFLLDWWVQGGIVGVGLIIIVLGDVVRNYIYENNVLYLTLLFGVMTVMLFNPVSVVTLVQFWWVVGQGSKTV